MDMGTSRYPMEPQQNCLRGNIFARTQRLPRNQPTPQKPDDLQPCAGKAEEVAMSIPGKCLPRATKVSPSAAGAAERTSAGSGGRLWVVWSSSDSACQPRRHWLATLLWYFFASSSPWVLVDKTPMTPRPGFPPPIHITTDRSL